MTNYTVICYTPNTSNRYYDYTDDSVLDFLCTDDFDAAVKYAAKETFEDRADKNLEITYLIDGIDEKWIEETKSWEYARDKFYRPVLNKFNEMVEAEAEAKRVAEAERLAAAAKEATRKSNEALEAELELLDKLMKKYGVKGK